VAVAFKTLAVTPLTVTVFSAAALLKLLPVIVIIVPAPPDAGKIELTIGNGGLVLEDPGFDLLQAIKKTEINKAWHKKIAMPHFIFIVKV
jgi:hypothetical protein